MDCSVGLVVPAYEPDSDTLRDYLADVAAVLAPEEIRIELDGEADVEFDDFDVTVNRSTTRRGKGAAIVEGFESLSPDVDILLFADADGSTAADSLAELVDAVRGTDVDVCVGSRRHPDATIESHQSVLRRRLGDVFAWTARRLLDVSLYDYQCGAKALTADAWRDVRGHLRERSFAFDLELVAVADALRLDIEEVPVTWDDDPDSTVDPVRTTAGMLRALFSIQYRSKSVGGGAGYSGVERDGTATHTDD